MSALCRRGLLWLVALAALGCGSDSNDPDDEGGLTGEWFYAASNLVHASYAGSCQVDAGTILLTQTGDSLNGGLGASYLICIPNGGPPDTIVAIDPGVSVRGAVAGSALTFEIDGPYWTHEGEFSGNDMSGTIALTTSLVTGSEVTFTGVWEAGRLLPP